MSVDDQHEFYDGSTEVTSDPFGIIDRDNRNHRRKAEIVIEETPAESGDRVLEAGCGHGLHAQQYAEEFDYTGIDISSSLVAETRRRITDGDVLTGNALELPYPDDSFDAVVGGAILHHIPTPREALREWQRVVRPGGGVTLMEPNYLFPKDLITAHVVPEEQHKTMMAPWRIRGLLDEVSDTYSLEPRIYSPPWPESAAPLFDRVDSVARRLPGLKWGSQMLLINIRC